MNYLSLIVIYILKNEYSIIDRSIKGKLPYITLNRVNICDSAFCIDYLEKRFGKDLNDHLTTTEKAISHAFYKLTEQSFYWAFQIHRFRYGSASDMGISQLKFMYIKMKKDFNAQGYGLHSKDEGRY